jgi:hypothetical protein
MEKIPGYVRWPTSAIAATLETLITDQKKSGLRLALGKNA